MSSYENTASNAYRLWYSISSANNDLIAEYSNERTDQYWTAIHGPIEDVHSDCLSNSQLKLLHKDKRMLMAVKVQIISRFMIANQYGTKKLEFYE